MIHTKNDEPMDEQLTDFLLSSSRCVFEMSLFIVRANTTQNALHSVVFYYMFRPFWPSSGRFSNIRGGFPFTVNTLTYIKFGLFFLIRE